MQYFIDILGSLLAIANRNPDCYSRWMFYELKKKPILRFGIKTSQQIQHIQKECFSCDGTGAFEYDEENYSECYKCDGSGYFKNFWTVLGNYRLGQNRFHMPEGKFYKDPSEQFPGAEKFEGYVNHKSTEQKYSAEAFLWLAIIFDVEIFQEIFGSQYIYDSFLPLTIFSNIRFNNRMDNWDWWWEEKKEQILEKKVFRKIKDYFYPLEQDVKIDEFNEGFDDEDWDDIPVF